MPNQTADSSLAHPETDRMLVRLLLVAELLLNPPSQIDDADSQAAETTPESLQKSDPTQADV